MVTLSSAAETLAASPLMHVGGWSVARVLNDRARAALAAEARRCHATGATEARLEASPDEELVRGNPARWLESAPGGPVVDGLYRAPVLHAWLRRLTGLDWEPSGGLGSYSYYRREGHFLGVHRDIDACDLAVITCVDETGAPCCSGAGSLSLWPSRAHEPLVAIRAQPDLGRVSVRLQPGESIVLLGGLVPHALEPLAASHVRIVSPLCFRARGV